MSELEEVKKTKLTLVIDQLSMTKGSNSFIDAKHKVQVGKIKYGIYADRQSFLENLLQYSSDSAQQRQQTGFPTEDYDKFVPDYYKEHPGRPYK